MKNLLTFILIHLVQHPDEVEVIEEDLDGMTEYTLKVNSEDIGSVIGRHGQTIQSIRNIAKARAVKERRRITVRV